MPNAVFRSVQGWFVRVSTIDALLKRVHVLDQRREGLSNRIGQVAMLQIHFFVWCMNMIVAYNHLSRHTDDHRIGRRGSNNHRIRPNATVVSYGDCSQHLGPRADDNMIANCGMALDLLQACPAQGDSMIERDTITDLGGFANYYSHAMIDE